MELLKNSLTELGFSITDKQLFHFSEYRRLLLEWNEKINLTAITSQEEIVLKHFADSLTVLSVIENENSSLIDVGTGAGFPSMPLKIMRPSLKLTLLDSVNKKLNFLRELTEKLELSEVSFFHGRAEDAAQEVAHRQAYDFAVSRAVSQLNVLSEYCLPLVKLGGKFVSMKGADANAEIADAKKAIKTLGGEISDVKQVKIPFTDITHSLIVINKIKETPTIYPRKAGKPLKSPII